MRWVGVVFLACTLVLAAWQYTAGRRAWRADCESLTEAHEQRRQTTSGHWQAEETRLQEELGKLTSDREQRLAVDQTLAQKKADVDALKRKVEAAGRPVTEASRRPTVDLAELARTREDVKALRDEIEPLERRVAELPATPTPTPPRN